MMANHDFHTKSNTLKTLEEINRRMSSGTNKISGNNPYMTWEEPLNQYEYAIQGQMFMVSFTATEHLMFNTPEDVWKQVVKKRLAMDLAEKMLEDGVIEFTQMQDSASVHKTIRARCYLVPDNQVRLIRTLYKD